MNQEPKEPNMNKTDTITLLRGESVKDKIIVVWFSCGAASAVAAKLAIDQYGG